MKDEESYEHFCAEMALGRDFQELSRTQQAVLGLATLLCIHDEQGWVRVSYLAQSLNMPEDALRTVLDELYALGRAWVTGPSWEDQNYVGTDPAEYLSLISIGPGGRPTSKQWADLRRRAYEREEGQLRCCYCDDTDGPFALDHAIPVSRRGSNHLNNLVWACVPCNSAKRDKTYDEFHEWRKAKCS